MANQSSGGGGGSGKEVRAGGAFVEFFAKDKLSKQLDSIKSRMSGFASVMRTAGAGLGVAGGLITAPLAALFVDGVNKAAEVERLAEALGFSTNQMQRFAYAAEVAGVSVEDVIQNQERFQKLIQDAPVMDSQALKDATASGQEFRKTVIELRNALTPLISSLIPVIRGVAGFVRENANAVRIIGAVGIGLIVLGTILIGTGAAISGAIALFSTLAIVAKASVVALAIGAAGFVAFKLAGKESVDALGSYFGDLLGVVNNTVGGIVAALTRGDMQQAWEVMRAGGIAAMTKLEAGITNIWQNIKFAMIGNIMAAINVIKGLALDLAAWMMRNSAGLLANGMTDAEINAARDAIKNGDQNALLNEIAAADNERKRKIAEADAEFNAANAKLGMEVAKAKQGVGGMAGKQDFDHIQPMITAVRGAFRTLGDARQFGMGETVAKKQLNAQEKQVALLGDVVKELWMLNKNLAFK